MTVRPTSSGQTPRPAIGRTERTATPAPASGPRQAGTPALAPAGAQRDDVQISAQARELQRSDAARAAGGDLSPERLREVLGRMNDGHYEQPDVQERVVRRLARDLQ